MDFIKQPYNRGYYRRKKKLSRLGFFLILIIIVLLISLLITYLIRLISPSDDQNLFFTPTQNVFDNPSIVQDIVGAQGDNTSPQTDNFTPIGPVMQSADNIAIKSLTLSEIAVVPNGRVDTSYFADAVFVGDSLTEGLVTYTRQMFPETTTFLYKRGINPLAFSTGTWNLNGTDTSPLQDIVQANGKKIYIMLGTNGITAGQEDDVILKYYEKIVDDLMASCPDSEIYIQSITPISQSKSEEKPEVYSAKRVQGLNESLAKMAFAKGVNYLNISEVLADENGYMQPIIAQDDGFHMNKEGYLRWVDYLVTHTKHSQDNPYLLGSPFYKE